MKRTKKANPAIWLRRALAKGPELRSDIKQNALAAGLSWDEIEACRKAVGAHELYVAYGFRLPKHPAEIEVKVSSPNKKTRRAAQIERIAIDAKDGNRPNPDADKWGIPEPAPTRDIRNYRGLLEELLKQKVRSAEAHSRAGKKGGEKKRKKESLTKEKVEKLAAAMSARGERVTNKTLAKKLGGKHPDYIRHLRKRT